MKSLQLPLYKIDKHVGTGGDARVYECVPVNKTGGGDTTTPLAIKIYHPSSHNFKNYKHELEAYHALGQQCENIAKYVDAFVHMERTDKLLLFPILIMELYTGNLRELIKVNPTGLPLATVRKYMSNICNGITYIHSCDYIHTDIKPKNIFVTDSNTLVIGDFDTSCHKDKLYSLTVGTYGYAAPELHHNEHYDQSIDVWSTMCVLYELCMGRPLFDIDNALGASSESDSSEVSTEESSVTSLEFSDISETSGSSSGTHSSAIDEEETHIVFCMLQAILGTPPEGLKVLTDEEADYIKPTSFPELLMANQDIPPESAARLTTLLKRGLKYDPSKRATIKKISACLSLIS